jgi:hypothetical protein
MSTEAGNSGLILCLLQKVHGTPLTSSFENSLASYNMPEKFKERYGLHDLDITGKNSHRVTGKGRVLRAEG